MSALAEHFHIELPSATSLINILSQQKLVARVTDPLDRRLVRVTVTEVGKTLMEQALKERRKKLEKIVSYLSDREKTDLTDILNTLKSHLEK
jgi:DNA-binding MarR family transcriptional regulator